VIGGEERLKQERQVLQQRLFGANRPLVRDFDVLAVARKGPNSASLEVATGLNGKTIGAVFVGQARVPMELIGQTRLGVHFDHASDVVRSPWMNFLGGKINGRAPAREFGGVAQNVEDLVERTLHAPMRDEVIIMGAH